MSNEELSKELSILVVERLQKEGKTYRDTVFVIFNLLTLILHFVIDQSCLPYRETAIDFFKAAIKDLEDEQL